MTRPPEESRLAHCQLCPINGTLLSEPQFDLYSTGLRCNNSLSCGAHGAGYPQSTWAIC